MAGDSSSSPDEEVEQALLTLRTRIAERVRFEQLRDQLTGLPNALALETTVETSLQKETAFWVAFIEVDNFKWINDKYTYQNADALLVHIANALRNSFSYFAGTVRAFRPHGDEFYLLGEMTSDADVARINENLDLIRRNIAALRIRTERGVMECTVSIGWLDTIALRAELGQQAVLAYRVINTALEHAVAEAKAAKDCVVRYDAAFAADDMISVRSGCVGCRAKISISIRRSGFKADAKWVCPNCGDGSVRPPPPEKASLPEPS